VPRNRAIAQEPPNDDDQESPTMKYEARWNNTVIAASDRTVEVEGNQYFPEADVNTEFLRSSEHHTFCHWKGEASYYTVEVNGETNPNAAWYYPQPYDAAAQIRGHIAFWKGVTVAPASTEQAA
jgi:uncharacterized protein (DUF427 family)